MVRRLDESRPDRRGLRGKAGTNRFAQSTIEIDVTGARLLLQQCFHIGIEMYLGAHGPSLSRRGAVRVRLVDAKESKTSFHPQGPAVRAFQAFPVWFPLCFTRKLLTCWDVPTVPTVPGQGY